MKWFRWAAGVVTVVCVAALVVPRIGDGDHANVGLRAGDAPTELPEASEPDLPAEDSTTTTTAAPDWFDPFTPTTRRDATLPSASATSTTVRPVTSPSTVTTIDNRWHPPDGADCSPRDTAPRTIDDVERGDPASYADRLRSLLFATAPIPDQTITWDAAWAGPWQDRHGVAYPGWVAGWQQLTGGGDESGPHGTVEVWVSEYGTADQARAAANALIADAVAAAFYGLDYFDVTGTPGAVGMRNYLLPTVAPFERTWWSSTIVFVRGLRFYRLSWTPPICDLLLEISHTLATTAR